MEFNTITVHVGEKCNHENYINQTARVNFYLFELTMLYKVCLKCGNINKVQRFWKIN